MWRIIFVFLGIATRLKGIAISQSSDQKNWWKTTQIYELYPLSFKDSDGDGRGDFKGKICT